MPADMSALNLEEIQEVMTAMNSFDNVFRDSSERERTLFLEMVIKRTVEKSAYQKAQTITKTEPYTEAMGLPQGKQQESVPNAAKGKVNRPWSVWK